MLRYRRIRVYTGGVVAVFVALAVAACGGSSSSSPPKHAASSSSSGTATNASATSVAVKTVKGPLGTYLVGPSGRALYLWLGDSMGKSNCSGACAKAWPPLTTTGKPGASGGVMSADLRTITRSDGTKQVTFKGHPLYYFAGDSGPGTSNGQGSDAFGARWWLVAPSGAAITKPSSTSSSSSSYG